MRRLDEVLNEMEGVAKAMEDKKLKEKFSAARALLKRDIVFSASLYLWFVIWEKGQIYKRSSILFLIVFYGRTCAPFCFVVVNAYFCAPASIK